MIGMISFRSLSVFCILSYAAEASKDQLDYTDLLSDRQRHKSQEEENTIRSYLCT